jgi:hypothetical protein
MLVCSRRSVGASLAGLALASRRTPGSDPRCRSRDGLSHAAAAARNTRPLAQPAEQAPGGSASPRGVRKIINRMERTACVAVGNPGRVPEIITKIEIG